MRVALLVIAVFTLTGTSYGQKKINDKKRPDSLRNDLKEVVVTGQYQPQSLKNSVYRTRIIDAERIRLRAPLNVQQMLNTELGFRFSNDLTLGTSDVTLMGMTGRNVKILLDGIPMVDRSDTRESLNQIDINTVERIEIVEGPLSVSYGSDALAGVINIITKKPGQSNLNINARVQEETVGGEYSPFTKSGSHLQHVGGTWQDKPFSVMAGITHNDFDGYNVAPALATADDIASNTNRWKPKEQWLANTRLGYRTAELNLWYSLNYLHETIDSKGAYNPNNFTSTNQQYNTNRYTQQLQGDYKVNDKLQFNGSIGYSNLQRATVTKLHDYTTGNESLSTAAGEQDISKFRSANIRTTAQYKLNDQIAFQPGVEINLDGASGARILGSPAINDYAFFISSELNVIKGVTIRPGLRFIENSVYDAPPAIPALNTKIVLNQDLDLRLSYASGFRAPALRELYYDFFDANHSIMGNPNLKAEQSNSYIASLSLSGAKTQFTHYRSVLSGFYNNFRNRIDYGLSAANSTITTLINVEKYKTTGGTLENTFFWPDFQVSVGFSYVGTYNEYHKDAAVYGESPEFVWSPEVNSNITYTFPNIGASVNLAYKFTGSQPIYELSDITNTETVHLAKTGSFHMADLMLTKRLLKTLTLNAGVKNLFDVTTVSNSSVVVDVHSSGSGPVSMNYGRSYVLGLSYNWDKK